MPFAAGAIHLPEHTTLVLEKITYKNFDSLLGRFSTAELEGLVQKFPYFQQGHLLLAKKYQLENNPKFDEQLQLAALYTQNRELLYDIFTKPAVENSITIQTEQTNEPETLLPSIDTSEAAPLEDTPHTVLEKTVEVSIEETPTLEVLSSVSTEQTEPEYEVSVDAEQPDLEQSILVEAPASSAIDFREPHTYDEWLQAFTHETSVVDRPEQSTIEVQAETKTEEPDELELLIQEHAVSADYLHGLVEEETKYSKGLDNFIQSQIKKHRQAEARKSVNEEALENEFVTETLAKLYESQRLYQKAIKAYQALAMKFPEKNDLFAARIEKLKKQI
ncbi:MAG: hypothetical protein IPN22_12035 [Bacteroidetes bacterium]|nr:hypothetical protein [Bacteroidota bacterium]